MILLEPGNRILQETVAAKIDPAEDAKREPLDVRLCDFDDVSYHVTVDAESTNVLQVSMSLPCWNDIKDKGGQTALEEHFKDVSTDPEDGYDISLKIDLDNLPGEKADVIQRVALLKAKILGGIWDKYFTDLMNKKVEDPYKFDLRSDCGLYFFPAEDRVTIIYALDFQEYTDQVLAKVFLQEFTEVKRHIGSAPPVSFSVNPPMELQHYGITEPTGNLGYVSFAFFENHLDRGKKETVVSMMSTFRTYLQYHIKCSKSHFHQRMRARVVSLLKVLNRAKSDAGEEKKGKKTFSGKTFKRSS